MGREFFCSLIDAPCYRCKKCNNPLAFKHHLISDAFMGRTGPASLFKRVVNIYLGPIEDRVMTTGLHTIWDIYCKGCHINLGWKYEQAFKASQGYKQNKYILEKELVWLYTDTKEPVTGIQSNRRILSLCSQPCGDFTDDASSINEGCCSISTREYITPSFVDLSKPLIDIHNVPENSNCAYFRLFSKPRSQPLIEVVDNSNSNINQRSSLKQNDNEPFNTESHSSSQKEDISKPMRRQQVRPWHIALPIQSGPIASFRMSPS